MLPAYIKMIGDKKGNAIMGCRKIGENGWGVGYTNIGNAKSVSLFHENLAEAMGKMVQYLKENKLI